MTATTTTSGLIQAGTTRLYHELRGSGPALLITGGTGDAGEWRHLAPTLAQECTVATMTGAACPAARARMAGPPPA